MKIAVSGKGGVGKTSLSALLARRLAQSGHRVLAVDADPNTNLAAALGFPDPEAIVPLVEMKDLIAERMGTTPGAMGAYFKLNPAVDDIPARFCREHDAIKLIVMGMVRRGGAGCACPENTFLKALLAHLILDRDEVILVDMEAGLEHLGRGTTGSMDGLIVVIEPSLRSIETLGRIRKLAADLHVRRIWPAANKVASPAERRFVQERLGSLECACMIPHSDGIVRMNRGEGAWMQVEADVWREVDALLKTVESSVASATPSEASPANPQ